MLMVGYNHNSDYADTLNVDLQERNLGGVILFAHNVEGPDQLRALTDDLRHQAQDPLFVAIDQEGGTVARLNSGNGFESTLTAYELGQTDSEEATRSQAAKMAGWLDEGGINMNLAPVVDVNVNPQSPAIGGLDRSFSDDPQAVTRHSGWFIDEFERRDIITGLKHFPGHGNAEDDSHSDFTDITRTWKEKELHPYEALIDEEYSGLIMPGHLYHSGFDEEHPATLSGEVLQGMIREELGFDGVIISDGMFMAAIQDHYGFFESVKMAINAGIDMLLYSNNAYNDRSLVRQIIDFVEQEVAAGTIEEQTITASYNRIMKMKDQYLDEPASAITETRSHPEGFELSNYPNPFNPQTSISFRLPEAQHAEVTVYDIRGRQTEQLHSGRLPAGSHSFRFDGDGYTSGVYIYRLTTPEYQVSGKMTLIR